MGTRTSGYFVPRAARKRPSTGPNSTPPVPAHSAKIIIREEVEAPSAAQRAAALFGPAAQRRVPRRRPWNYFTTLERAHLRRARALLVKVKQLIQYLLTSDSDWLQLGEEVRLHGMN